MGFDIQFHKLNWYSWYERELISLRITVLYSNRTPILKKLIKYLPKTQQCMKVLVLIQTTVPKEKKLGDFHRFTNSTNWGIQITSLFNLQRETDHWDQTSLSCRACPSILAGYPDGFICLPNKIYDVLPTHGDWLPDEELCAAKLEESSRKFKEIAYSARSLRGYRTSTVR